MREVVFGIGGSPFEALTDSPQECFRVPEFDVKKEPARRQRRGTQVSVAVWPRKVSKYGEFHNGRIS